jgi:phytoene dehydrogenase-like protein
MHFTERGTAAYSCWPGQGWDGMWADLADAIRIHGGELRLGTQVERVIIENHEVKGIAVARQPRILPNEFFEEEVIEAPCVISTLPVWHVLNVVPEEELPDWYTGQIRYLAQDRYRIAWLGLYLATEEPVAQLDPRELSTWLRRPT